MEVVSANKGPIVLFYREIHELARQKGCGVHISAATAAALPTLDVGQVCLAGTRLLEIEGILNGSTNYILTRMQQDGCGYEVALKEAQELGIAETDPSYDVEGKDTACKLVILANDIFGIDSTYKDVEIEGIIGVTLESLKLASDKGYTIKLIGEVGERLRVAPRLVPKDHILAVGGTLNIMSLNTDLAGDITITGKGAGAIETSSSILSDVINIAKL